MKHKQKSPAFLIPEFLRDNLYWVEANKRHSWAAIGLEVPRLFIHTGWRYPHFVSLADEVRAKGGKVIGMFDNSWKNNFRQRVGALYFRAFLRRKFAEVWVPGQSGARLARCIGFPSEEIRQGLYGASQDVFQNRVPINKRAKRILFVGRLIDRKGIIELATAFEQLRRDRPEWALTIIGNGPHDAVLEERDGIELYPFSQPERVADLMNDSRVLALPSREEHWGLVVHEAALCGCGLLLTKAVGAGEDLVGLANGERVQQTDVAHLKKALKRFYSLAPYDWAKAEAESLDLSKAFGPRRWVEELQGILL